MLLKMDRTTRYMSLDKSSWWQILLGFLVVRYSFETALTMSKIQSPFVLGRRSGALLTGTISLRSERYQVHTCNCDCDEGSIRSMDSSGPSFIPAKSYLQTLSPPSVSRLPIWQNQCN